MLRSTFVVQTVVTFVLSSEGSDVQQDRLAGQSTQRCSLTAGGPVSGYVPLAAFFNGPPGNYEIFTKVKEIIETKCCLGFCCVSACGAACLPWNLGHTADWGQFKRRTPNLCKYRSSLWPPLTRAHLPFTWMESTEAQSTEMPVNMASPILPMPVLMAVRAGMQGATMGLTAKQVGSGTKGLSKARDVDAVCPTASLPPA
jgi:hypothetical protein